jgi:thioredoxin 1
MPTENFETTYRATEPSRNEVDALKGPVAIEFGAPWCPICQGAQPDIQSAVRANPSIQHIKIEDGSGRPLGRSFRIKLWPTVVVLKDGVEVARVVRPHDAASVQEAIAKAA